MDRGRWLALVVLAGAAIVAFSFAGGWIVHDRELRGEGYRQVRVVLDAWRPPAFPVLGAGVVAAALAAIVAALDLRRPGAAPAWALPGLALVTLALLAASVVPIGQDGRTSSVDLSVGWVSGVGIVLAALIVVGALAVRRPGPRAAISLLVIGVVLLGLGAGGRWLTLQAVAQTGEHWSDGTYVRGATDGQGEATLVIHDGRFTISDRWRGTWEGTGLTIAIDDDSACPGARGAYHVHDEGPERTDLRFVAIVDTCAGGARAAELETGIWIRQP